ncbi:hypothetical protein C9374_012348 [Naegleria lovaniensis]|uniref:BTB domain-containing protein n=1 Tax=Naegleria lovaniensis TaxID=51637 RepID=A0AA88G7D5_NAELO|nr:uncharacterized protein C9374_012348 [Naegleria lovaniensis]KAG2373245.1 hypothetical protein C9374_012348 [Naegleria lovaniensis]
MSRLRAPVRDKAYYSSPTSSSSSDNDEKEQRDMSQSLQSCDSYQRRKGLGSVSSQWRSSELVKNHHVSSSFSFGSSSTTSNPFSCSSVETGSSILFQQQPITSNPFSSPFSLPPSTTMSTIIINNENDSDQKETTVSNDSNIATTSCTTNSGCNDKGKTTLPSSMTISEPLSDHMKTLQLSNNEKTPTSLTTNSASTTDAATTEANELDQASAKPLTVVNDDTHPPPSTALTLDSVPAASSSATSASSTTSPKATVIAVASSLNTSCSNSTATTNNSNNTTSSDHSSTINIPLSKPSFVFGDNGSTTSSKTTTQDKSTTSSKVNRNNNPFSFGVASSLRNSSLLPAATTSLNNVNTSKNLSTYDVFVNVKDFSSEETPISFSKLAANTNFSFGTRVSSVNQRNCIKKYNRDLLFGTEVFAFIPFLKIVVPNFTQHVLLNQRLIQTLTTSEQQCLQFIIDFIMSSRDSCLPVRNLSLAEVIACIFLVNRAKAELIDFKVNYLLKQFKNVFSDRVAIDSLELIDSYLEREKQAPQEVLCGLLQRVQRFCLEYVGSNSPLPCFDIEKEPRIEKYLAKIYRFKTVTPLHWFEHGRPSTSTVNSLSSLYKDPKSSDVKITIGEGKFIDCHKTVLSSASEFFETQFNSPIFTNEACDSSHLQEIGVEPHIMEYIVKYAYECFDPILVPSEDAISLLKTAHLYRMKGLVDSCLSIFNRNRQSYLSIVDRLSCYLDDPMLEPVRDMLIQVGAANLEQLFKTDVKTDELMKIPQDILVKITQLYFQQVRNSFAYRSFKTPVDVLDPSATTTTPTSSTTTGTTPTTTTTPSSENTTKGPIYSF